VIVITTVIVALITFGGGYAVGVMINSPEDPDVVLQDEAFYEVLDELINNHYTQPEREDLIDGAIDGMIASLDDPFTRYFDNEEAAEYQAAFGESYIGIGVTVRYENNYIVIEDVNIEGPAFEVGLRIGDVITHVDGEEIGGLPFYETIGKVIGDEDTEVIIGIYRAGYEQTLYFPITRRKINNSSIEYEMFEENGQNVGYIKVTQFGDETYAKFHVAVVNLENMGMDSLIVDLRDNGGGHLGTVYAMLNEFLIDDGNPMFSTEYYIDGEFGTRGYAATNTERKDYNIVTIINENSASASEVFASAMKEHGGYTLVGETSFGKGTMQTDAAITATIGDSLHITIGKWITADGGWVHYDGGTDGITPDIVAEKTAVEKAYKIYLMEEDPILFDTVDPRVSNIQIILNMMEYTVRTDGYFDTLTRDAIEDIQSIAGLTVTGTIDEVTLAEINEALQEFILDNSNDTQLQAAILYILDNPDDPNE